MDKLIEKYIDKVLSAIDSDSFEFIESYFIQEEMDEDEKDDVLNNRLTIEFVLRNMLEEYDKLNKGIG